MSIFALKTNELTWQDRTINVEFMIAPAKSQLLYNKHKGLKTKYEQESIYLEREKDSFLKAFKTEQRLMERRKDMYSKRRNDIIMRRASGDVRRRWSISGRISAPARLEQDLPTGSKTSETFITEISTRESKSAGARIAFVKNVQPLESSQIVPPIMPDIRTVSPCVSMRTNTPGKPYLLREKSVHFQNNETETKDESNEKPSQELPIEERIKLFLNKQAEFNKRGPTTATRKIQAFTESTRPLVKKVSGLNLNMVNLESAFDEFCTDSSPDGLNKLVKYATKMKACARNARNSQIMPTYAAHLFLKT